MCKGASIWEAYREIENAILVSVQVKLEESVNLILFLKLKCFSLFVKSLNGDSIFFSNYLYNLVLSLMINAPFIPVIYIYTVLTQTHLLNI